MTLVWPSEDPLEGSVRLRRFDDGDLAMVIELATDPYVPTIGSLEPNANADQAAGWIERQRGRLSEGAGFSFCIADRSTDRALGMIGLWTAAHLAHGRATAGYAVAPSARGRHVAGDALRALTAFGWTVPGLHRIELYIEPWNLASRQTARAAGYHEEGLLRSHQQIDGRRRDMLLYAAIRAGREPEGAALHRDAECARRKLSERRGRMGL